MRVGNFLMQILWLEHRVEPVGDFLGDLGHVIGDMGYVVGGTVVK